MERYDINTLRIIEALEGNPAQTQRDLSRKLKISLGLVNSFTRRLTKKGFLKIATIPKNRIQYILTPKGLAEKTKLTYQYILYSMEFYKDMRSKLKALFGHLSEQNIKEIFLFGAGELSEIAYIVLQETDLKLKGIIDDDVAGDKFMGMTIKGVTDLAEISSKDVVVVTKVGNHEGISDILAAIGISTENVIYLNI